MPKTSDPTPPRIVVHDVHKDFKLRHTHSMKETFVAALKRKPLTSDFHALDGASFAIGEGESVALLGFNGSGKSTMLKLISGVLTPDRGSVKTRGRVAGLIEVGAGFHPDLSGRENIYLNAAILGMTRAETDARFDDIVAFSEIEQFIDTEVKHYSSGMFLRLAFAVAIHTELDVLLIDEILAVGDEPFQRKCLARIRDLHRKGKTLVVVSHDLGMVSRLCARGIVLADGKVAFDGPSTEAVRALRTLSRSPFTDVEREHPYFDEILEMTESGALPGYPDENGRDEFRLSESVTLGAFALALQAVAARKGTAAPAAVGLNAVDQRRSKETIAIGWLRAAASSAENLSDGDLEADRIVTRQSFAGWLWAFAGSPIGPPTSPFADVSDTDRFADAIGWLHDAGIALGWDDPGGLPTFGPDYAVSRESLVMMLTRYQDLTHRS